MSFALVAQRRGGEVRAARGGILTKRKGASTPKQAVVFKADCLNSFSSCLAYQGQAQSQECHCGRDCPFLASKVRGIQESEETGS